MSGSTFRGWTYGHKRNAPTGDVCRGKADHQGNDVRELNLGLAIGGSQEDDEANDQKDQHHLFHGGPPICSEQMQWEKVKPKGRCQCHASSDGGGQSPNYLFHGVTLF